MQLEVETAGVADWIAVTVSSPQGGVLRATIGTFEARPFGIRCRLEKNETMVDAWKDERRSVTCLGGIVEWDLF